MSMMPSNPTGDSGGALPPATPGGPPGVPTPAPAPSKPRGTFWGGVGELLDLLTCCTSVFAFLLVLGVLALCAGGTAIRILKGRR